MIGQSFRVATVFAMLLGIIGCSPKSLEPAQTMKVADEKAIAESELIVVGKSEFSVSAQSNRSRPGIAVGEPTNTDSSISETEKPSEAEIKAWAIPDMPQMSLLWIQSVTRGGPIVSHPDGRSFIHAGERLARWDIGKIEPETIFLEDSAITAIAISQDGNRLFAGDSEGKLRVWDVNSGDLLHSQQHSKRSIVSVAVSPSSDAIAACDESKSIVIYDGSTLEKTTTLETGLTEKTLFYLNDGVLVAMGYGTEVWNSLTRIRLAKFDSRRLYIAAPDPVGNHFLYPSGYSLEKWPAETDSQVPLDGIGSDLRSLQYSPDGTRLSLASNSRINIVDVRTNKRTQVIEATGGEKPFKSTFTGMSWMPGSNLLVTASVSGLIRIVGTPEAGKAFGLEPVHAAKLSVPERSSVPPSVNQLKQLVDLRALPKLPRSRPEVTDYYYTSWYNTSATIGEARNFYRYVLGKQGWTEIKPKQLEPFDIEFRKSGYGLFLRTSPARAENQDDASRTEVSLGIGDFNDMGSIPVFDEATSIVENEDSTYLRYRTQAQPFEIEIELLKKFRASGWIFAVDRMNANPNATKDRRNLDFLQNGCELSVEVYPISSNVGWNHVIYRCQPVNDRIPVPTDCDSVETQPFVASSDKSVAELTAFYDSLLQEDGWYRLEPDHHNESKMLRYAHGLNELTIELSRTSPEVTRVLSGQTPFWDEIGTEAADFPIIDAFEFPSYAARKEITFDSESPWNDLRDKYVAKLKPLDWSLVGESFRSDIHLITFKNGSDEIVIEGDTSVERIQVTISGNGMNWYKPVPTESPVILPYSSWLRSKGYPLSLEYLDEFEKEMRMISELGTSGDETLTGGERIIGQ